MIGTILELYVSFNMMFWGLAFPSTLFVTIVEVVYWFKHRVLDPSPIRFALHI